MSFGDRRVETTEEFLDDGSVVRTFLHWWCGKPMEIRTTLYPTHEYGAYTKLRTERYSGQCSHDEFEELAVVCHSEGVRFALAKLLSEGSGSAAPSEGVL